MLKGNGGLAKGNNDGVAVAAKDVDIIEDVEVASIEIVEAAEVAADSILAAIVYAID